MMTETVFKWRNGTPSARSGMKLHTKGECLWLSFPLFDRETWLMNAFSTRLGGVSSGFLSSMNFSRSRGDTEENIRENFRRIAGAAGFDDHAIVCSEQEHTTNVALVTRDDCGRGVDRPPDWTDVDGMVTNVPGVVLATFYADCVPLFFADPVHRAIGLSHSGWRGTAAGMGRVTVQKMQREFGSYPKDLIAAIGPSICQNCYEVSEDVAERFPASCLIQKENGKYLLDLELANVLIMREAGIPETHIVTSGLCTSCNRDLLFSHRGAKGKRGNLGAFFEIRPVCGG